MTHFGLSGCRRAFPFGVLVQHKVGPSGVWLHYSSQHPSLLTKPAEEDGRWTSTTLRETTPALCWFIAIITPEGGWVEPVPNTPGFVLCPAQKRLDSPTEEPEAPSSLSH